MDGSFEVSGRKFRTEVSGRPEITPIGLANRVTAYLLQQIQLLASDAARWDHRSSPARWRKKPNAAWRPKNAGRRRSDMKRVVILGRGASGKSTLARRLGEITGVPVVELDKIFWRPGLIATSRDEWVVFQEKLVMEDRWIMDGDLGRFDNVEARLRAADTVIFLDFSFMRCAWRAIRRSRERADFWWWVLAYRRQSRPVVMKAVANYAADAELHIFRDPESLELFIRSVTP